jgi:hypothetical protein
VVDGATGIPVGGATVALRYSTSPVAIRSAETGTDGTFRIDATGPGYYAFEASAPGYLTAVVGENTGAVGLTDSDFEPGANKVVPPVTLKLRRAGALSGRVRDAQSGKPLRQITVRALRALWLLGMRRLREEAVAFSDAGGDFHFEQLAPGEYILEIQNRTAGNSGPGKKYPLIFRPAQGPDSLATLNVQSGGEWRRDDRLCPGGVSEAGGQRCDAVPAGNTVLRTLDRPARGRGFSPVERGGAKLRQAL